MSPFIFNRLTKGALCALVMLWWALSIVRICTSDGQSNSKIRLSGIFLSIFCLLLLVLFATYRAKSRKFNDIPLFVVLGYGYCSRFYSVRTDDLFELLFWGLHSVWYYFVAESLLQTKIAFYTLLLANSLVVSIQILATNYNNWYLCELIVFFLGCSFIMAFRKLKQSESTPLQELDHRTNIEQDSIHIRINDIPFTRPADEKKLSGSSTEWGDQAKGILMLVPQGIIIFNEKTDIQSSNYSARRVLGLDESKEIDAESFRSALARVTNLKIRREDMEGKFIEILEQIAKAKVKKASVPTRRPHSSLTPIFENFEKLSNEDIPSPGLSQPSRNRLPDPDNSTGCENFSPMSRRRGRGAIIEDTPKAQQQSDVNIAPQIKVSDNEKLQGSISSISFLEIFEYFQINQLSLFGILKEPSDHKENIIIDGKYMGEKHKVLEFGLFAVSNPDGDIGGKIILTIADITLREVISVAENNSEFKENLISSFSHELRTPLHQTIISLECAQADNEISEESKKTYIIPALRGCRLLLHIVKDILDLSQLHFQNLQITVREFNLKASIESCIELFEASSRSKKIQITLDYPSQLNEMISSDNDRVCQILVNLLSNALKYTNFEGKIKISCSKTPSGTHVEVSDDGLGMTPENLHRLQESFESWEVAQRVSTHSTGAGFGLYTTNQLALLLSPGGSKGLSIKSETGSGSSFSFDIQDRSWLKKSTTILMTPNSPTKTRKNGYLQYNELKSPLSGGLDLKSGGSQSFSSFRKISYDSALSLLSLSPSRHSPERRGSPKFVSSGFPLEEIRDQTEDNLTIMNENIEEKSVKIDSIDIHSSYLKKFNISKHFSAPPTILKTVKSSSASACKCNKVLVVDDDGSNIFAMEMLLSHFKIKADSAHNGKQAIVKYRERIGLPCGEHCEPYKMILMDVNMPEKNGIEATKVIRDLQRVNNLPSASIIGCTAYVQKEMSACLEAGMDTCYQKPIMMVNMKEILDLYFYSRNNNNRKDTLSFSKAK